MNNKETIESLRKDIYRNLEPLIQGKRTILTDLPYHGNVGDILIWEGELNFLNKVKSKLLSQTSSYTFQFPELNDDIVICLQGGGSFGDLYHGAQEFRKKIIATYPNNRIIIFPQSVWYENQDIIGHDAEVFSTHLDLHICARDLYSYKFFKQHFSSNNIYLVPDMAFCISDITMYYGNVCKKSDRTLFINRLDKEMIIDTFVVNEPHDERDWLSFEGKNNGKRIFFGAIRRCHKIRNNILRKIFAKMIDMIMSRFIKASLIRQGVMILEPYNKIYTTRLHAMILAILMDKDIVVFDNITKKLSSFYDTWLKENNRIILKNI